MASKLIFESGNCLNPPTRNVSVCTQTKLNDTGTQPFMEERKEGEWMNFSRTGHVHSEGVRCALDASLT